MTWSEKEISSLLGRLFPINRSITGDGLRESLGILGEFMPLETREIPTGTPCFGWEVPPEWNVRDAFILDGEGRTVADFKDNNLHLMGYSIPFDGVMPLEELKAHLYTLEDLPDAIPFTTSYYERKWGFCMSHRQYERLQPGMYRVHVDATLEKGSLTLAEGVLAGSEQGEYLLHSYLGHPSMANDQLSGPLTLLCIYQRLLEEPRPLRRSVRFLFTPETIGTIAYISQNLDRLKANVLGGYVVCFTGDDAPLSYKPSRNADSLSNRAFLNILEVDVPGFSPLPFRPIGCDER
ncbi:MAG: DUF4910 domain-containing protein, partial [Clostridia bacterium]